MIIKKLQEVPPFEMPDHPGVTKQIVLGPADESNEIVLRYFSLAVGAASPHHAHGFPHLVRIESGNGVALDEDGSEHPVTRGDYLYINDNKTHQFRNTGSEPFNFICIVPRRGEE